MLNITRIDIKTGLALQATIEGSDQDQVKCAEHSFLEHWLSTHQLEDSQFYTGKFYTGINDIDRLRLEEEGKVLVFSNGKDGYFTDAETARLMTEGDLARQIFPIYASGKESPHNFVAYGSLVASDGIASTSIQSARILIIDNNEKQKNYGEKPLLDKDNQPLYRGQVAAILAKMGDGTMLVRQSTMKALITEKERDQLEVKASKKASVSAEQLVDALAANKVTQFRAATTSLPGIIKGTMGSSVWCDRLNVDAIISTDDIKGDDGRLSTPGIIEVKNFWLNRKSDGQYGYQAVGPQVKYCIPEATLKEFNPIIRTQAEELAAIAGDHTQLSQHYKEQKEKRQLQVANDCDAGPEQGQENADWLSDVLEADRFQQLARFSKVNKELNRYLKGEWTRNALQGISAPSAMAQHHNQLKLWEVCNKNLKHGTIVACYRSPLPNVGAAGIAIVNNEVLREKDSEAFSKDGVAYFNPWLAEYILITDFDRDANAFVKGYQPTVQDLPEQFRQQLFSIEDLPKAQQYEAWRSLAEKTVYEMENGNEDRIKPSQYPLAVKEFIKLNAPDVKPPQIKKQKKVKHPWEEGESHSSATWRAFEITANNKTGMVANRSMTLQALALDMQYSPPEQKEKLLREVSGHYSRQLERTKEGKLQIPDDAWLKAKGFPAYRFQARMEKVTQVSKNLDLVRDHSQRQRLIKGTLRESSQILMDFVNGPNAANLQIAVDSAKSSTGIDTTIHRFSGALQHKPDLTRETQKAPGNYIGNQTILTSTQEPVAWGINAVNAVYHQARTQLDELPNEAFKSLFPKDCTPEQDREAVKISKTYNQLLDVRRRAGERLQEKRPEDNQPTLLVTADSGRQLVIQSIKDDNDLPIWRANGPQPNWTIAVKSDIKATSESTRFPASLTFVDTEGKVQNKALGYVSKESANEHKLRDKLQSPGKSLAIKSPNAKVQAPFAQQNDADALLTTATSYAKASVEAIPEEERPAYLSAFWRESNSMDFGLKRFNDIVAERLDVIPDITVTGVQYQPEVVSKISSEEHTIVFNEFTYTTKGGVSKTSPSISLVTDGKEEHLGALDGRSIHLLPGTKVTARIAIGESGKTATIKVLDLVEISKTAQTAVPEAVEALEEKTVPQNYAPTRHELLQWATSALKDDDEPKVKKIIEMGTRLNSVYKEKTGSLDAKAPSGYSHPSVAISTEDYNDMNRAILENQTATDVRVASHVKADAAKARKEMQIG